MKTNKSSNQNYALVLMIVGIGTYIAVDTGLFDGSKFSLPSVFSGKTNSKNKTQNPEESLLKYSSKLNEELRGIENDLKTEKKKLKGLQSQVTDYEKAISKQKANLSALEKEIKTLSKLKQALVETKTKVEAKEEKRNELLSRKNKKTRMVASENEFWSQPPTSNEEIGEKLESLTGIEAKVENLQYDNKEYLRLKTKIKYDDKNGYFLTQRGIRQAVAFSEAGLGLGYTNLVLAYSQPSKQVEERLSVIQRYLSERYGDRLKVSGVQVNEEQAIEDDVELWLNKGEAAR